MTAKDLRIGNLVWYEKRNTKVLHTIVLIGSDKVHTKPISLADLKDLEPIPLTDEWLLKFGFESNPYQDRYEFGGFHIQCSKITGYLLLWIELDFCHIDLKHVHQLQNLFFALTGEELTIK